MSDTDSGRLPAASAEHLARLEDVYHGAPTNRLIPARLQLSTGAAHLEMPIADEHAQAVGQVHGMLYFKALDESSFYAANTLVDDVFLTTASLNVQFLAPLTSGPMLADATVVHAARSSFIVDATVRDTTGRLLARSTGTFVRTSSVLRPVGSR